MFSRKKITLCAHSLNSENFCQNCYVFFCNECLVVHSEHKDQIITWKEAVKNISDIFQQGTEILNKRNIYPEVNKEIDSKTDLAIENLVKVIKENKDKFKEIITNKLELKMYEESEQEKKNIAKIEVELQEYQREIATIESIADLKKIKNANLANFENVFSRINARKSEAMHFMRHLEIQPNLDFNKISEIFQLKATPVIDSASLFVESTILPNADCESEWEWLLGNIQKVVGHKCRLKKVFESLKDGFSATSFHEKCDNVKPILILAKSEHNRIFGGFANAEFTSPGCLGYIYDPPEGETFRTKSAREHLGGGAYFRIVNYEAFKVLIE